MGSFRESILQQFTLHLHDEQNYSEMHIITRVYVPFLIIVYQAYITIYI